jgi:hypothetical protein
MENVDQIEVQANELAALARSFSECLRTTAGSLAVQSGDSAEATRIRKNILLKAATIRTLVCDPEEFLQQLAIHNQLIACLHWLAEFQVLACIPSTGSVSIKDVAQLSDVPEAQLQHIIRMSATAGLLHEAEDGHVRHTPISAQFASRTSFRDAAMFLAEHAAPAALQMARHPKHSAEDLSQSFEYERQTVRQKMEHRPKLERQCVAFFRHIGDECLKSTDHGSEVLTRLDWWYVSATYAVWSKTNSSAECYPFSSFLALYISVGIRGTELLSRIPCAKEATIKLKQASTGASLCL